MKSAKASIHGESTAATVVNEGHRNDSEVPVAGNVEVSPLLDPHGPLAPPPDPAGREALSASSPEVCSPYILLSVNSEAPLRDESSHPADCGFLFQSPRCYTSPRVQTR